MTSIHYIKEIDIKKQNKKQQKTKWLPTSFVIDLSEMTWTRLIWVFETNYDVKSSTKKLYIISRFLCWMNERYARMQSLSLCLRAF